MSMRPGRLTSAAYWLLLVLVVLALVGVGFLTLKWAQRYGGVAGEAWRILVTEPWNLDRVISILAVALIPATLVLAPLALAETRAVRAFERAEARIRLMWPAAVVTPYEGEEGTGLAFDTPDLRVLLLRPEAGIGEPRVVNLAPPASHGPEPAAPPSAGDERTSPMGS
jgi:hypothetical protein